LTGERNRIANQNKVLTAQINSLAGQATATNGKGTDIGSGRSATTQLSGRRAASRPKAEPWRPRRAKFLIIGNMRSGTTWLQTMLGALPDVATDYEIKWAPTYQPSGAHIVLDDASLSVSEMLAQFESDAPVVGSKFVFDPLELTRLDMLALKDKIGEDVRII